MELADLALDPELRISAQAQARESGFDKLRARSLRLVCGASTLHGRCSSSLAGATVNPSPPVD